MEHRLNVLDQRDGLNWLYISRFVVYLLKQSNDAAALKLAYHLLERDELGELAAEEPALLRRCIELINADTKLQPDVSSHSKNLDKVLELSYQNQIQLRPNKIELQHLLNMMTGRMIDKIKTEQSMEVMRDHFIYLTEKEYEQFVQSILNAHVTTYGEKHVCIETDKHVILLRGLCKPDKFNENFKKIYIAWLDKTLPLLKDKSCLTDFIELWLTRNESYTEGRFMKSIAEKVTDLLAEALTLHSDRKLCMASLQTAVSKSKPAKERYKELISTAHKLKPSRWSKWNPRNWF
jgi:hypothetical protein